MKKEVSATELHQENYRFWNPNALALGGKTALLNQTQALKYI